MIIRVINKIFKYLLETLGLAFLGWCWLTYLSVLWGYSKAFRFSHLLLPWPESWLVMAGAFIGSQLSAILLTLYISYRAIGEEIFIPENVIILTAASFIEAAIFYFIGKQRVIKVQNKGEI